MNKKPLKRGDYALGQTVYGARGVGRFFPVASRTNPKRLLWEAAPKLKTAVRGARRALTIIKREAETRDPSCTSVNSTSAWRGVWLIACEGLDDSHEAGLFAGTVDDDA